MYDDNYFREIVEVTEITFLLLLALDTIMYFFVLLSKVASYKALDPWSSPSGVFVLDSDVKS